ncbi:hypothetical protein EE612_029544 [Oryza sativa]|nr:hypothetical protein EE612_029544 [Oryza sativa]
MQVCARRYINNPSYFSARHALSVYIYMHVYSSDTPFFFLLLNILSWIDHLVCMESYASPHYIRLASVYIYNLVC